MVSSSGGTHGTAAASKPTLLSLPPPPFLLLLLLLLATPLLPPLLSLLTPLSIPLRHDENEYGMTGPLASNSKQGSFRMIKTVTGGSPLIPLGPSQPVM